MQSFLLQDLSLERLSHGCEANRQKASRAIESIIKKIRHSHPSIRPRVNTPGGIKKPAPPPPLEPPSTVPEEEEEEEGELYVEPQQAEVENYLSFKPEHSLDQGEEPQEMYEAMESMAEQDVYEDPGAPGVLQIVRNVITIFAAATCIHKWVENCLLSEQVFIFISGC